MKRKFIVITALLSFFLLSFHYVPFLSTFSREQFWQIFAVLSLGSSIIAFWGTWRGFTILPLLVLPTLYPLGITFFSSLLPDHWIVPLLLALWFGISFYFLLLVENIYAVSSIRAIPLIRAALPIGVLFTVATAFLLLTTIFSIRQQGIVNGVLTVLLVFPLSLQSLWAVKLDDVISERVIILSLVTSLVMGEIAGWASLLPGRPSLHGLFLAVLFYCVLSVVREELEGGFLKKSSFGEYAVVGGIATIGFLFFSLVPTL
ncbi:MAG: hypothetical protein Q8R11_01935 [bacterium]|nr:hypothetical protein [bacterium]